MPRKRHSKGQILAELHEGESGTKIAEICPRMGIGLATYFAWKKKAGLGLNEVRLLIELSATGKQFDLYADPVSVFESGSWVY